MPQINNYLTMKANKTLSLFAALLFSGMNICAQNFIEGYTRVFYPEDLKDGKTYFLISDRMKYAGNNTGKPKGMSYKLDNYKISWDVPSSGIYFVYWGDFDAEEEGFQWIAEKVGDNQWAFKNKVRGEYIGVKNSYDDDVLFSATPIGYTLSDLNDGAGRFFMTSSENSHSPHVQGYLRSDRPNNSLAKQNVGDDDYPGDGATYGYPGRWQIYEVEGGSGDDPQPEFYTVSDGYYNIVSANPDLTQKMCWSELMADALAYEQDASLFWEPLHNGDPRSIFYIEAVDKQNGLYKIRNYVTDLYVSNTTNDGLVFMSDELQEPLTFRTVPGDRRSLYICNADGEILFPDGDLTCAENSRFHIYAASEAADDATWKLQKVDAAQLESPSAKLRLALALKMEEVGLPDYVDYYNLNEEQKEALRNLWYKADKVLANGAFDIIYERYISELVAAVKGKYTEPVYNKYEKGPLRVLSYNVKHCAGNKDGLNLPRTARVISAQNADVVALQEVDSVFSSRSNYKYQVKELAEATGMYGIFCSALSGYGIGILSKEMPLSIKVVSLTSDFEPRRMLIAEFSNYVFASLHVGLSASARRGTGPIIKAEAERWVATGKPLIIAGDFNDDGTDDEMQGARGVLTAYLRQHGFTYHSDLTTPTWSDGIYVIDHIISYDPIGGVEKVSYEVVNDKVTSDHMPIVGNFIIGFEDPDGIKTIGTRQWTKDNESGIIYDLSGRQMANGKLPEGIYIFNGKKVKK